MYQNGYLQGSPPRFSAKSAINTAAGCQHKIAIYKAAVPEPIQIYIHGCRVSTLNRYLHGSHSRAKSAIYIAGECIQKIFLNTGAVQ